MPAIVTAMLVSLAALGAGPSDNGAPPPLSTGAPQQAGESEAMPATGTNESRADTGAPQSDLQALDNVTNPGEIVNEFGKPGETLFFPDPTRRCGVMVFCDDALGTTIGVVMTALWESDDFEQGWRQDRRFWQEKEWSLNVTSFGWSRDGRYLFVATCDIYRTGKVYQLDMQRRRWAVLFPREPEAAPDGHCWSSELVRIEEESVTFHVRDYCDEDKIFVRRTVPLLGDSEFGREVE